jgi:hypothetical protein
LVRGLAALGIAAALAGCGGPPGRVDARDHDTFWLWAGTRPQPVLKQAKTLYVLEGEVRGEPARYVPLRPQPPRISGPEVWLVVRTDNLHWPESAYAALDWNVARWGAENRLTGVQIDFDARTRRLGEYGAFLRGLRKRLPAGTRLSVTGLMDWSANGDPAALAQLSGTVDEVVIQTYQGRSTIAGYSAYVRKLDRFPVPFRIGLVQGGEWREPAGLRNNPGFRGYVVFLLNPD